MHVIVKNCHNVGEVMFPRHSDHMSRWSLNRCSIFFGYYHKVGEVGEVGEEGEVGELGEISEVGMLGEVGEIRRSLRSWIQVCPKALAKF